MEWLIIAAGVALGFIPFFSEVKSGVDAHRIQREREERERIQRAHDEQLHRLDVREKSLLLEMHASPDGAWIEDELDRVQLERRQLTGRKL